MLFACLQFRLTDGGALHNLLWKVYPPTIRLEFADGSIRKHRIVWRNGVSGFLISELPASLNDVDALWNPKKRIDVKAITFFADPADFDGEVEITWQRLVPKVSE